MMKNQLTEILSSFNKTEFREFEKFVASPYFNNRSEVIRFFESIKKFHPKFNSENLTEENLFKIVYPGKKFSSALMRKLISLMSNLLLDFIAVKGFKDNKFEYNTRLIDKLRERNLNETFEKRLKKFTGLLENSKRNLDYYEAKVKMTSILNGFLISKNEKSMVSGLQDELDELIEFFLVAAILQYLRIGEWSRSLNKKFDQKFYNEVVKYISSGKNTGVTLSTLYFNMLMLLNTEEEKYYTDLIKGRQKFEPYLSGIDEYNISIVSMQYCYKKIMKGESGYRKQMFEIANIIIEKNLIPAGNIDPYFFTNVIRNAVLINEFEWSENFINDYEHRLNPENADEIIEYSNAMIGVGKGDFEKSLNHLSKINIDRSNMKLDMKNLLIVIYYELNYSEELISLIDTHRHFLQRDKSVPEKSKSDNSAFLKSVSDLMKLKLNKDKNSVYLLKKRLENASYFSQKEWLLKKAEELLI